MWNLVYYMYEDRLMKPINQPSEDPNPQRHDHLLQPVIVQQGLDDLTEDQWAEIEKSWDALYNSGLLQGWMYRQVRSMVDALGDAGAREQLQMMVDVVLEEKADQQANL
jgi:hypothetical protein